MKCSLHSFILFVKYSFVFNLVVFNWKHTKIKKVSVRMYVCGWGWGGPPLSQGDASLEKFGNHCTRRSYSHFCQKMQFRSVMTILFGSDQSIYLKVYRLKKNRYGRVYITPYKHTLTFQYLYICIYLFVCRY